MHLGYALIQLPETLIYMYKCIKARLCKIAPPDGSTRTEEPRAVYRKPHGKGEVESSPTMRMILQQFPINGTNQQNNQNMCQIVKCIVNAHDTLTMRMDKIENKNSSTL